MLKEDKKSVNKLIDTIHKAGKVEEDVVQTARNIIMMSQKFDKVRSGISDSVKTKFYKDVHE